LALLIGGPLVAGPNLNSILASARVATEDSRTSIFQSQRRAFKLLSLHFAESETALLVLAAVVSLFAYLPALVGYWRSRSQINPS
jgi:hypothetical protein